MCSVMLAMIIFVLDLFKFPVTLNFFTRFPLCSNFIFATVSYCSSSSCFCYLAAAVDTFSSCCCPLASSSTSFSTMSFNLCRPYSIFSIIFLYNKEAVSRTLRSLCASASHAAAMGAHPALHNFETVFLKNVCIFRYIPWEFLFEILWTRKMIKGDFP